MKITFSLENKSGEILCSEEAEDQLTTVVNRTYSEGDKLVIETDTWPVMLELCLDPACDSAVVYLAADRMEYPIPFGEGREAYRDGAFAGASRPIRIRKAEKRSYGNISVNPLDRRGETTCYPHCTANVETRDESVFAARNTIDGSLANTDHGHWPFTSWGDNENPQAEITIHFGRPIRADRVDIRIRADFPHDNYWKEGTLTFSDGTREKITLTKTAETQTIPFASRTITWIKLGHLIKGETESPFPALTEWDVYGEDIS